jgi:DNA-binding transcriptional MerR regulator
MKVGELSHATGSSIRSLRYYETVGLLAPGRSSSGQRFYVTEDIERVQAIRRLLSVGLGTRAIAEVLPCMIDRESRTSNLTLRLIEERDRLAAEVQERVQMIEALEVIISDSPFVADSSRSGPSAFGIRA